MENELIFQTPQVGNQFLRDTSFSPLNLTYSYGLQPRIGKNFEFLDGGGVGALGVSNLFLRRAKFKTLKDLRAAQPKIIVQKWALCEGLGARSAKIFLTSTKHLRILLH